MDGPKDRSTPGEDPVQRQAELDRLAEDWITLWQSEITALAADREAAEAWAGMAQHWAAIGAAWLRAASHPPPFAWPTPFAPEPSPAPGPRPEPPRPATAAAPPDPGRQPGHGGAEPDAGGSALDTRLAELERRLAEIEGGPGRKPANRGRPRRRRPPA